MNLPGFIRLLAGILSWTGCLLSLPVFGWLIWGALGRARHVGRIWKRPHGDKPGAPTGRLLQGGGKPGSRGVARTMDLTASLTIPWLASHAAALRKVRPHGSRLP